MRFYVVLDVKDEEWLAEPCNDTSALATWIDGAMNRDGGGDDVESTVYDKLEDFLHDHVLDSLAEVPE